MRPRFSPEVAAKKSQNSSAAASKSGELYAPSQVMASKNRHGLGSLCDEIAAAMGRKYSLARLRTLIVSDAKLRGDILDADHRLRCKEDDDAAAAQEALRLNIAHRLQVDEAYRQAGREARAELRAQRRAARDAVKAVGHE